MFYDDLFINRCGECTDSCMITTKFIGEIEPNKFYKIDLGGGLLLENRETFFVKRPKRCVVNGDWNGCIQDVVETADSNILGTSCKFVLKDDEINIPVITKYDLEYYGVELYDIGDVFQFKANTKLPFFEMYIGKNYVDEFIMKKAGGVFIEKHDRPHYHIPLDEEAGGHVVIGKVASDGVLILSAFRIPYGSALYMPANVIHNDCFLTGRYGVVYSKTDNYLTTLMVNRDGKPVKVNIVS